MNAIVSINDPIIAPSRGSLPQVAAYIAQHDPKRTDFLADYLANLWTLCTPDDMPDFIVAAAQAVTETAYFTSFWWVNRGNPAGLGITGDGAQDNASPTFATGKAAARGQIAHLLAYATGSSNRGGVTNADDPRHDAYVAAYGAKAAAVTVGALAGQWAMDKTYSAQISAHGTAMLAMPLTTPAPDAPQGDKPVTYTPTPIIKSMIPAGASNRDGGKLDVSRGPLHITIHETANYGNGADALMHAAWVKSQDARNAWVSVHFFVSGGPKRIVQCLPLDEIAYHAGDGCNDPATDVGCFRSVAIERCDNPDGDETEANEALAELMTRIAAGDPAFDWGGGSTKGKFDTDHYDQHIWVSQEVPPHDCPNRIRYKSLPPWDWTYLMGKVDAYVPLVAAALHPSTPTTPAPKPPAKTPDASKLPVPGIPLPKGVTTAYLKRRFAGNNDGKATINGRTYAFDANDPLSRAWLRKALASIPKGKGYEDGEFPAITGEVNRSGDGSTKPGVDYLFGNGWTVPTYATSGGK